MPNWYGIQKMRRTIFNFGSALALLLCIWGHLSEVFDHWDNTFRTGNDIEYSAVKVALVVGAVICLAHLFAATPDSLGLRA